MPSFESGIALSSVSILQASAIANAPGAISKNLTGFDGKMLLEISNGAGTATLTLLGSFSPTLAVDQESYALGLILLSSAVATGAATSTKTTGTSRAVVSGAVSVLANTSYLYQIVDPTPYIQAALTAASNLGAGTQKTGLSAKIYALSL